MEDTLDKEEMLDKAATKVEEKVHLDRARISMEIVSAVENMGIA